jgi:hypothetical protein
MTKRYRANGVESVGTGTYYNADTVLSLGSKVIEGHKPAVGKPIEVSLDAEGLAFLLSCVATRYPYVVRALEGELTKCDLEYGSNAGDDRTYDAYYFQRSKRIREAVRKALRG